MVDKLQSNSTTSRHHARVKITLQSLSQIRCTFYPRARISYRRSSRWYHELGKYLLWLLTILIQTPVGESDRTEASTAMVVDQPTHKRKADQPLDDSLPKDPGPSSPKRLRMASPAQESPKPVRPLQHSIHRDRLMKSRSQISAPLDAQQTLIGTLSLPM